MSSLKSSSFVTWRREWPLGLAVLVLTLTLVGKGWIASALTQPVLLILLLAGICGVILAAAVAIVRHADVLAHRMGEPAGTLLLTLAITGLEVAMVAFVMSSAPSTSCSARCSRPSDSPSPWSSRCRWSPAAAWCSAWRPRTS